MRVWRCKKSPKSSQVSCFWFKKKGFKSCVKSVTLARVKHPNAEAKDALGVAACEHHQQSSHTHYETVSPRWMTVHQTSFHQTNSPWALWMIPFFSTKDLIYNSCGPSLELGTPCLKPCKALFSLFLTHLFTCPHFRLLPPPNPASRSVKYVWCVPMCSHTQRPRRRTRHSTCGVWSRVWVKYFPWFCFACE